MGWFSDLFAGGKHKEETKKLSAIVKALKKDMDTWIKEYPNDGTPPNEDQCKELEDAKIGELVTAYETQAREAIEEWNELAMEYKGRLEEDLGEMKGDLYRRFSGDVDTLENLAARVLKECVKQLSREEAELKARLPVMASVIDDELNTMMEDLTEYISTRFPEGATGLDNYDDALPDGIPSWSQFKEQSAAKAEELKGLNQEAIPAAIEETKANTLAAVKKDIDAAINKTMDAVKEDLSDDTFPFLTGDAAAELRAELIAMSEEYGKSRLSEA